MPPGAPLFTPATPIAWSPIVGETPLTFSSVGAAASESAAAPLVEGAVSVGGTVLGEGALMAGASTSAVVVEGAIIGEGAVTVGGVLVAEGAVVTGGTVAAGGAAQVARLRRLTERDWLRWRFPLWS